ncbi:MAG: signal peptidase I [Clostridia bacterium]|nr:signal peptidase I [Clostridia bacterium]
MVLSEKTQRILNIVKNVAVYAIMAFAIFMMIFTIFSASTFNKNDRSIFGIKMLIVQSDSMATAEDGSKGAFNAGDLIFSKELDSYKDLQEGDIITFQSADPKSLGQTITHKIRSKTVSADGSVAFVTYGTTTNTDDDVAVVESLILGKYVGKVPFLGQVFGFLKTTPGYIVCILIPFLLLILFQGLNCVKLFKQYRAEQVSALQAEREKLEAEREESKQMMATLIAMQQQMASGAAQAPQPPAAANAPAETTNDPALEAERLKNEQMMQELMALKAQLAQQQAQNNDNNQQG